MVQSSVRRVSAFDALGYLVGANGPARELSPRWEQYSRRSLSCRGQPLRQVALTFTFVDSSYLSVAGEAVAQWQQFRRRPTVVAQRRQRVRHCANKQNGWLDLNSSMVVIRHNYDQETDVSVVCSRGGSANAAMSSPSHNGSAKAAMSSLLQTKTLMFDVIRV